MGHDCQRGLMRIASFNDRCNVASVMAMFSAVALLACVASSASGALPQPVVDINGPTGRVRILDVRPDAPVATLISLVGGGGFSGIQDDGSLSTLQGRCSPVSRNQRALAEHGYAVALLDDAATANLQNMRALIG